MTESKREELGHYELVRRIGEGGMGEVFEAFDSRIERRAAIKRLHPQLGRDPVFAHRFINEARAANRVVHPGVVNIYDFGQAPDGSLYIVMEYLDGETLQQRLRRMPNGTGMDASTIIHLAGQIASALCAVHDKGIVHRDLKPANIIIVSDPDMPLGERVKLLDFGIAKLSGVGPAGTSTSTGVGLGTVHYMAPEQCVGANKVDGKADVYALGVLLYESLSGRRPIDADDDVKVMARQITVQPEPLLALLPQLSPSLAELTMSMLAKLPEERPTMLQVFARLQELSGRPAAARPGQSERSAVRVQPPTPGEIVAVGGRTRTGPPNRYGVAVASATALASTFLLLFGLIHHPTPRSAEPHPAAAVAVKPAAIPPPAAVAPSVPVASLPAPAKPVSIALPPARPVRPRTESTRPPTRNEERAVKQPAKRLMEPKDVRSLD